MPSTVVKASDLLAAIADGPARGDVIEVEAGRVNLGNGTAKWPPVKDGVRLPGDYEVRPRVMPPDVLGPLLHGGANMSVTLDGSLDVQRGVRVVGMNIDSLRLGSYGPGTLLLAGNAEIEDVRIASRHIGFTAGQFSDRAKGVRMKRIRLENIGIGGSAEAKYRQAAYIKAVEPGGFDMEDFLIYGGSAYSLHFYPNSVGAKCRRGMCVDNAWGIIYSGELGNTSTGGSGSSHDNGVHATIVAGNRGNANGTRRAIESWWGGGASVGTGNVFGQGAYSGGASGSGYSIVDSIQVAPKFLNPGTPGDYRQAPDSPTAHLGPLSLRPGGVVDPPPPPPDPDPDPAPPPSTDTSPPVLAWVRPEANAVLKGSFLYTATATDPSGIEWVEFRLVNASKGIDRLLFRETSAPYGETPFDSTLVPDGPYSLTARARDRAGNEATISRAVTVANAVAPPPPDPDPDPPPPDPDLATQLAAERAAHAITAGERNALIDQVTRIRAGVAAETQRHLGAIADIMED